MCILSLATSCGLITFSSIKQVIPLASFSSSGFCVSIAERAHLLFLRGKIVCGITTTLLLILWSYMKHSGGGRLRCVVVRGSTVTGSSSEETPHAFVLGACWHGLFLIVTNLSLAFSEDMSEQTIYGSQIFHMPWHSVDRYVLCTGNSGHTSHFILCGTSSM